MVVLWGDQSPLTFRGSWCRRLFTVHCIAVSGLLDVGSAPSVFGGAGAWSVSVI